MYQYFNHPQMHLHLSDVHYNHTHIVVAAKGLDTLDERMCKEAWERRRALSSRDSVWNLTRCAQQRGTGGFCSRLQDFIFNNYEYDL